MVYEYTCHHLNQNLSTDHLNHIFDFSKYHFDLYTGTEEQAVMNIAEELFLIP